MIIDNAEAGVVIAEAKTLEKLDLAKDKKALAIELIPNENSPINFNDQTSPFDEAYVIYTCLLYTSRCV